MVGSFAETQGNNLVLALNRVLQLDGYALTLTNLQIGKLPNDPAWLASVHSRIEARICVRLAGRRLMVR